MRPLHLERNLRALDVVFAAQGGLFWVPVFVLWFSRVLDPSQVLALEAVYYGAVVLIEVPSGWMSDRLGRRTTLMCSGLGWVLGAALIGSGSSFAVFAAGQVCLAGGRAFASGTDSSMLYETLVALDRGDAFRERLGRAVGRSFAMLGVSALVGGALGAIDLRLPYLASVLSGLVAIAAAWWLVEPPPLSTESSPPVQTALRQAGQNPRVRWVFLLVVAMTVFTHIPYELQQPWLRLTFGSELAAALSGVIVATSFGAAAWGSHRATWVQHRLGFTGGIAASMVFLAVVMSAMMAGPWWFVVPLLALRSLPTGLLGPLADAEVHPLLPSSIRATWLSFQSLAGRLAFAVVLMGLSASIGDTWSMPALQRVLLPCALVAGVCSLLVLTRSRGDG